MKVQIINKHSKENLYVGMRVGLFGDKVVPDASIQIDWKEATLEPTVWSAENNFCAEISERQLKAVKRYFKKNYSEWYSLKITDRKEFDNENSSDITYKGFDANSMSGFARDFSCSFAEIEPQAGDYIDGIVLYREDLINLSWDDRYAVMSFVTEYDKKNLKKLEVHKWTKCALSDVSNGNVDYTNGDPISKLHLTLVLLDAYKQTRKIQDKFEKRVRKFLDL